MDMERKSKLVPIEGFPPDLITIGNSCPFQARCVYAVEKSGEENPKLELAIVSSIRPRSARQTAA